VKRVLTGKRYITAAVAEKLAASMDTDQIKPPHEILSDREFAVFKMLANGQSITEIAETLFLSATTVSTYRARILMKMNMKNNAELTLYCVENKMI
jgi:DNA-binding NarL/FixJ family response regulator